jgi:8-oxo-dGTP pyrophosphatase MutT (NUDIX family)
MELHLALAAAQRPTAWVIVYSAKSRRILMLRRSQRTNNPGLWNFPGGGVEGQNIVKSAKRELEEEAGLSVRKSDLVPVRRIKDINASYFVAIVKDESIDLNVDPKESSGYKWMTLREIEALGPELHKKTNAFVRQPDVRDILRTLARSFSLGVPTGQ